MKKISYLFMLLICLLLTTLTSCGDCKHENKEMVEEVPANCIIAGKTAGMICSDCGEYIVTPQTIPTIDHNYVGGNCSSPSVCSVCGLTGSIGDHDYNEWYIESHATVSKEGLKARTCKLCGAKQTEVIPVVVHTFGSWYVAEESTCSEEGYEKRECSTCGYYETKTIATKEHTYGAWTTVTEAKCDAVGTEKQVCTVCEHEETRDIPTISHTWGSWTTIEAGSCTVAGTQERACTVCNTTEENKLTAPGHTIVKHQAQAATCTEVGHDAYDTCANCDYTTYVEIPATNHSYGNWYVFAEATATADGEERRDCTNTNCTHYESRAILATGVDSETLLNADLAALTFPTELSSNYALTQTGANGTQFTYSSSNTSVLDDDGTVTQMLYECEVILTVVATLNNISKEKEVKIKVLPYELPEKQHRIVIEADELAVSPDSANFTVSNGYVELKPGVTQARFYTSEAEGIITPYSFKSLVASWGVEGSSANAYVRVRICLRINGTWSNWVNYGQWGFERTNGNGTGTDSTGTIKISTDEVMPVSSSAVATGFQYEVYLYRTSTSVASPKFKYLSIAPEYTNYTYTVNRDHLPEKVYHNVVKRCQTDVAGIGSVICSATTTTMMLEYHGIDFSAKMSQYGYSLPQEYVARKVVYDSTLGGYGNWAYNTAAMSHYGFKAYVARYFSIEELMQELIKGPVGISIKKCTMTAYESYLNSYTHSGHLIVAVGYQYIDGKLYITCNDPFIKSNNSAYSGVLCNYSEDLIKTNWKYVGYFIEQ